jgi:hypothetical protein
VSKVKTGRRGNGDRSRELISVSSRSSSEYIPAEAKKLDERFDWPPPWDLTPQMRDLRAWLDRKVFREAELVAGMRGRR